MVPPQKTLRFLRRALLRGGVPAAAGLAGCTSLYFPPPPHAPLLTQKSEFYGSVSTNQQNNFAFQGAYAFADHLAAAGTFSSLHRFKSDKTENFDFGEASVGYFTRLPDRRVLEVYAGLGGGSTDRTERSDDQVPARRLEGSLAKVFVQVNYASKKKKSLHLGHHDFPLSYGTALRLSYVQLNNFRIDGQGQAPIGNVIFEPVTFTRVQLAGPFQLQLMSGQAFGFHPNAYLKAANSVFQLGVIVSLGGSNSWKAGTQ
ncbi:hypothetical protein ACFQ48_11005 [Hymenobacter caeli]|uniref:Outer membrane protein beta-barrel domain-containing protein n=1 Tax=Hymenobacter caeli TaxID=2735894 RepID=A0ABX2FU92_9BACT|nr:hypothetical protein [Hymenobacter caeli]NRT19909.1 hypothetical protein [Hymenobacter caeli]